MKNLVKVGIPEGPILDSVFLDIFFNDVQHGVRHSNICNILECKLRHVPAKTSG